MLYKKRWEIELLFKKIKQNFPLQYFYGDNKNAIQIQIWCTHIFLLLISLMKKRLTKPWSFSNLVSLLQKHLFSYVNYEETPNMPAGYAGMILLSFVSPLWFFVMNKKLEQLENSINEDFSMDSF